MNYYNEFDPNAAAWLRALIEEKLIPAGCVDERSITDVSANDLSGYTQCHFFAGIGGWSLALQLAGWPADRPVWTGSCPCQPFSAAGKQLGKSDERHLWPEFFRLIRECRPATVFGEQVASKLGREWLSGVFTDLEGVGYAVAGADLCAAGVQAPHIRQRLFWVSDSSGTGARRHAGAAHRPEEGGSRERNSNGGENMHGSVLGGSICRLGDSNRARLGKQCGPVSVPAEQPSAELRGDVGGVADIDSNGCDQGRECLTQAGNNGAFGNGFWSDSRVIQCRDGKARRISTQPALFPLADGLPYALARRGSIRPALLKGAGNAIVPQVAAEFIKAAAEAIGEMMDKSATASPLT